MCSIVPMAKLSEIDHIMNEKIDLFNRLICFVKKTNAYLCAVILEIDNKNNDHRSYAFTGRYIIYSKNFDCPNN